MRSSKLLGITFDLDGTLADTMPVCYAAFRSVFLQMTGKHYSDEEIHAMFGPSEQGVLRSRIDDWQTACELFLKEYDRFHDICSEPFPGIAELIDWLRAKGLKIAIVTGKGAESAEITLGKIGLAHCFETVEAGSMEGAVKHEAISRIRQAWDLPAEEVAHIGDAPNDVRAALACGIMALGAAWANPERRHLLVEQGAEAVFDRVEDFRAWLAQSVS